MSEQAREFRPPFEEPVVGDLVLHVTAGRLDALGGVVAAVQAWNGTLVHADQFALGKALERRRFARVVSQAVAGVDSEQVEEALARLSTTLPAELRSAAGASADAGPTDAPDDVDVGNRRPSKATQLVRMACDAGIEPFHTPGEDPEPYIVVPFQDHREVMRLRTRRFRQWLCGLFYGAEGQAIGGQALQDALNILDAHAVFRGPEHPVFTRVGECGGVIYLDLGNARWEAIEITVQGWRIVADPPVKFRRARGMLPLPAPLPGGSVADLRSVINIGSDDDWRMVVAWLLAALRPSGPYPLLALHGEQGSSKTWSAACLRNLVDPNRVMLRAEPRELRDLIINGMNSWVVGYDNLSHLPVWLSDALCRLSTGGGFGTRELYTNDEEALFDVRRPVIVTGIEELAIRPGLQDRTPVVFLPPIPEDKRRPEAELVAQFEAVRPAILGALLDAVSAALRNLPTTYLDRLPRMADFAVWVVAAEEAVGWERGSFMRTYSENRENANEVVLEASAIAAPVLQLVPEGAEWRGTASELLAALEGLVTEDVRRRRGWPTSPRSLAGQFRRLAPNLRAVGVGVEFAREGHSRTRRIQIVRSDRIVRDVLGGGECADDSRTVAHPDADDGGRSDLADRPRDRACADGADDADYDFTTASHVNLDTQNPRVPITSGDFADFVYRKSAANSSASNAGGEATDEEWEEEVV